MIYPHDYLATAVCRGHRFLVDVGYFRSLYHARRMLMRIIRSRVWMWDHIGDYPSAVHDHEEQDEMPDLYPRIKTEGFQAALDGAPRSFNPYRGHAVKAETWDRGYESGLQAARQGESREVQTGVS